MKHGFKKSFVSSLPNKDSGWLRADGDIPTKSNRFFDIQSSRWIQAAGKKPMNNRQTNFFKIKELSW